MAPPNAHHDALRYIDARGARMRETVEAWASVNSGSLNVAGLQRMADLITPALAQLGEVQRVTLPGYAVLGEDGTLRDRESGPALSLRLRPEAERSVLLCIHMDTVYGSDHPFQHVTDLGDGRLGGPGVADAKGGLVVLITALEALERSGLATKMGVEVLVTPDEELGAPASLSLLREVARRNDIGLLYEPAREDGALIDARKGSGNFSVVTRGRAAHAGRAFADGRNAIVAMARLLTGLDDLNGQREGLTVNVGRVIGGGAVNVVPDRAFARFNVRYETPQDGEWVIERVEALLARTRALDGIDAVVHGGFTAAPKPCDPATSALVRAVQECGAELGLSIDAHASGGVCDGNRLAAAGLTCVDTLGVRGGSIHSSDEYVILDSLTERAKLSALLLMRLATGALPWPATRGDRP